LWFPKDRVAAMNVGCHLGALGRERYFPAEVLLDWSGGWAAVAILAAVTRASRADDWVVVPKRHRQAVIE